MAERRSVRPALPLLLAVSIAAVLTPVRAAGRADVAEAARRGDAAGVKALLARGADVNAAEGDGLTALHFAASRGDAALASTLVRAHANVGAATRLGGYTPLHMAA